MYIAILVFACIYTSMLSSAVASVLPYSVFTQDQIKALFAVGTRVVRGSSWTWGTEDGYGAGTITMGLDMKVGR